MSIKNLLTGFFSSAFHSKIFFSGKSQSLLLNSKFHYFHEKQWSTLFLHNFLCLLFKNISLSKDFIKTLFFHQDSSSNPDTCNLLKKSWKDSSKNEDLNFFNKRLIFPTVVWLIPFFSSVYVCFQFLFFILFATPNFF